MATKETQGAEAPEEERPTSLWRNHDYRLLWAGQCVSLVGDRASGIAFPLLILAVSGSAAQAGIWGMVNTIPYVVFSLLAGALSDRWNRKVVMIVCDTGRALALATIPVAYATGHLSFPLLLAVGAIEGTLFVFFDLSQVAALPRVVTRAQLPAATAQNTIMYTISYLVGPPLGGALFGAVSRAAPFLVDAISYGGSVISLFFIKTRFQAERVKARRPLQHEIAEGLHWLWSQPLLRFLALLAFGFNIVFFSAGYTLILIILAKHLHASSSAIGAMFAVTAFGGIGGALLAGPVRARYSFGAVMIATGWLLVALFPLYFIAPNPLAVSVIAAALGTVGTLYNIVQISYRLVLIPDELQGRVNSVFRLVAFAGQPVGAALAGVSLQIFGLRPTMAVVLACLIVMAVATTLNSHVRHAEMHPQVPAT